MKKFIFATLIIALVALSVVGNVAFAEQDYQNSEAYLFLKEFSALRRSGLTEELAAAQFLKDKYDTVANNSTGYSSEIVTCGNGNAILTYNFVATVQAPFICDKQVIVSAHFDAVGQGANDNASGVTAMYLAFKQILQNRNKLSCNVVFAAFGGEEQGMVGSQYFVSQMTSQQVQNTLVVFNLECVANGDNLYVHCENKPTDLANLIVKNSPENAVKNKPFAVGTYPIDLHGYGFYEKIQDSDHTPFRLAGIPTALLFSGNFSGWNYVESTDKNKNTMNTNADTFAALEQNNGSKFVQRIETVAQTVCQTLFSAEFSDVAEAARNQLVQTDILFNVWYSRIALLGCLLLLALFAWLYYRKLQKNAILGTGEIKTEKVFETPGAEEIFSFDSKEDGIDDIFTFKK